MATTAANLRAYPSLVGTVGYAIYTNAGALSVARTTSGISEVPTASGQYVAAPSDSYIGQAAVWDTGGGSPVYATDIIADVAGAAGTSPPRTRYVATTGSDSNSGLSWGAAKLTVQAAVTAAASGDTILIGPGTFTGQVDASGKSKLRIRGSGKYSTILTDNSATGTLIIGDGIDLADLTLTATATPVYGVSPAFCLTGGTITDGTIRSVSFNSTDVCFGPEFCVGQWTITDCEFNGAESGIVLPGGGNAGDTQAYIARNLIRLAGWDQCDSWPIIASNLAVVTIDANTIYCASATGDGTHIPSGISVESSARALIVNNSIEVDDGPGTYARGIEVNGGAATVIGNTIATSGGVNCHDLYNFGGTLIDGGGNSYSRTKTSGTITYAPPADKVELGFSTAGALQSIGANVVTGAAVDSTAGAEIADAVWDEAIAGHLTAGTTGDSLNGAGGTTLTITPLAAAVSNPRHASKVLAPILQGSAPADLWTITDATGTAVSLSGKTIRFVVWQVTDAGDDDDRTDDTIGSALYQYQTGGAGITVAGVDSNQVTVQHSTTNTATVGKFNYAMWNVTNDLVLARGTFEVQPARKST